MNNSKGFSLTEMSIVVVVISLIIAGIMQGRNLIESAKVRAIVSETSKYKIALNSFIAKYDQLPGDFTEAVAYWGASTADGDGNGQIEFSNTAGTPVYEGYRAWQHLSYARMVNASYAGTETTLQADVTTDVPPSKAGGGFFLQYGAFGITESNLLILGMPAATADDPILVSGLLKPGRAHEIDKKTDDGVANTGSTRGQDGSGATAQSCVVSASGLYKLSATGNDCTLGFKITVE